jgi:hypothetical protein
MCQENFVTEGGITKLYIIEFVKAAYNFVQTSNEKSDFVASSVAAWKKKILAVTINRYNRS